MAVILTCFLVESWRPLVSLQRDETPNNADDRVLRLSIAGGGFHAVPALTFGCGRVEAHRLRRLRVGKIRPAKSPLLVNAAVLLQLFQHIRPTEADGFPDFEERDTSGSHHWSRVRGEIFSRSASAGFSRISSVPALAVRPGVFNAISAMRTVLTQRDALGVRKRCAHFESPPLIWRFDFEAARPIQRREQTP